MSEEKQRTDESQMEMESLAQELRSYLEKRAQLMMLTISERVSRIIAHSLQKLVGLILLITALYFFCFALGFYLGELLGNFSLGFAAVSIPFLLFGMIFFKHRSRKVTEKIQADIIGKMMVDLDDSSDRKNDKETDDET